MWGSIFDANPQSPLNCISYSHVFIKQKLAMDHSQNGGDVVGHALVQLDLRLRRLLEGLEALEHAGDSLGAIAADRQRAKGRWDLRGRRASQK
jgi:hypothetical protein